MSIRIQRVNNQVVRPIRFEDQDKKIKGGDVCSEVYANIGLIAKKNSGKTLSLFHLLKECIGKGTKEIIIFCTTLYKDRAWIHIRKWLDEKEIPYQGFTSIYQDGENQIEKLINRLNEEAEEREAQEEEQQAGAGEERQTTSQTCDMILEELKRHNDLLGQFLEHKIGGGDIDRPKKKRKDKYLCPEYFIIMDDIGNQLKNPALTTLLNWNRHYKAKVIVSTQYLNHLLPDSRKMMDLFLIFKGQPLKKLQEIYADADISIPFELFVTLYRKATKKKFSFLWIDTREEEFRRNFTDKFHLPEPDDELE